MARHGRTVGGTDLFRLYDVGDAEAFRDRLAGARVLCRVFPYSATWVRLGLPPAADWDRLEAALA
jgi:cobalamin biosynthetic protein CobC